jgi:hypothetical protein
MHAFSCYLGVFVIGKATVYSIGLSFPCYLGVVVMGKATGPVLWTPIAEATRTHLTIFRDS